MQVYEYVVDGSDECVRCEGVEGIASFVKDNQQYGIVSHHLTRWALSSVLSLVNLILKF